MLYLDTYGYGIDSPVPSSVSVPCTVQKLEPVETAVLGSVMRVSPKAFTCRFKLSSNSTSPAVKVPQQEAIIGGVR